METKQCIECEEAFKGRIDKKFCSDYCRNIYHNKLNSEFNSCVKEVNAILKRNRKILMELTPEGKNKVHRETLLLKGYQFNYFTNIYTTKSGKKYVFCYEYGWLELEDDYLALVKKEEYVY